MGVGKSNRPTWCPSFLVSSLFPILLRFDSFRDNSCVPPTPSPSIPIIVPRCRDPCSSWTFVSWTLALGSGNGSWNVVRSFHSSLWLCGMTMSLVKVSSLFFFSSLLSFFLLLLQGRESSLVGLLTWLLGESKKERKERGDEWLLTGTRRRRRRCAMDE